MDEDTLFIWQNTHSWITGRRVNLFHPELNIKSVSSVTPTVMNNTINLFQTECKLSSAPSIVNNSLIMNKLMKVMKCLSAISMVRPPTERNSIHISKVYKQ